MALKDTIARTVAKAKVFVEDEVWPDVYEVIGEAYTPDDEGGGSTVPATIESGVCWRKSGTVREGERVIADKLGYTSPVIVNLPAETVLTPNHSLIVNGVPLEVGEVKHDANGNYGYQTVAICQERNP